MYVQIQLYRLKISLAKPRQTLAAGGNLSKINGWVNMRQKEASFRQSDISYEQLGNELSKASKDNWMGEFETNMETSFRQNNIF